MLASPPRRYVPRRTRLPLPPRRSRPDVPFLWLTGGSPLFARWAACIALAVWAGGAVAQPIPAGPGLGAEADTLTFAVGAAFARVRPPVIPQSVEVIQIAPDSGAVAPEAYLLDPRTGAFRLIAPFDTLTTLVVRYRRFPSVAGPPRLPVLVPDSVRTETPRSPTAAASGAGSGVQTTGSITRGVVAGSNRDVSLTSGLRLDVSGEVAPGVRVEGALTDTDTPIVPEGTTQTLSDFDRVFVRIEGPGVEARLGDVDLALDGTAFAPIRRSVQGATVSVDLPRAGALVGGRALAGASAVRGRFRSQDLVLRDGVQGPYRLEGDRGEPFVLVVPGSERVYWDGQRLTRGQDYTVDYGTGEVTFTASRLVTAERRATVDFEFSAGGYARTLTAIGGQADLFAPTASSRRPSRATVGLRVLREADAPGLGDALGLSDADLDLIAASGLRDATVPGETRVPFDPESPFVLYTARDTTTAEGTVRIFVPAEATADSVFRVRFTRVRAGQGSYRRAGQALNGLLYEWVGPGGGDYEPFRILPRPASRRVIDAFADAEIVPGVVAFAEGAQSVDDANTLSGLDPSATGGAYETGLRLDALAVGLGEVSGRVVRRYRADEFRTLDRVRRVDFNRRWNLARAGAPFESALDSLGEASTEAQATWALTERTRLGVDLGTLEIRDFRARRAGVEAVVADLPGGPLPAWVPLLRYTLDAVASDSGTIGFLGSGSFFRQAASVERPLGAWTPSLALAQERRQQDGDALPQDTLLAPSYRFVSLRPGLAYERSRVRAAGAVEFRREAEPLAPAGTPGDLADASRSLGAEVEAQVRGGGGARAEVRAAYRRTRYRDEFQQLGREDVESLALSSTVRVSPFSRAVDVRASYEALTERTPVLQEAYVLVGAEAGQFVWRDGEGEPRAGEPDGRQQVDEFFPETTPFEGTYLRTFVPSDELFPAIGVGGQLAVRFDGSRLGEEAGWARVFDTRASVEVRERSTSDDILRVLLFDPGVLQQPGADGAAGTVDGRFRADAEVALWPRERSRGLRLGTDHLTTTRQLAAGAETRLVQNARAEGLLALGGGVVSRLTLRAERRQSVSDAFGTRTFDLRGIAAEPAVDWTLAEGASLTIGALLATRTDTRATGDRPTGAFIARVPVDLQWTRSRRLAVTARAEFSAITLRGSSGTGLALFELTDGRGAGVSGLGGVQATLGLSESIRATLTYDLRVPAESALVQTVRASVSATF